MLEVVATIKVMVEMPQNQKAENKDKTVNDNENDIASITGIDTELHTLLLSVIGTNWY